ncbi:MAG: GNAT family N-acetyltransferase [Rhodospirillaceae bacterium]|nr:GNAT family N-acetyltransferase [Rhodospirillaceae bacterium]
MLTIRPAELDDAPTIARVHVDTWRSSYGGIIPQAYLDSMTEQNRTFVWVRLLERQGHELITLVSEDHNGRVVGFISAGPLRHRDARFQAEISSLYVARGFQRANHGRRLFMAAANRLAVKGLKGLFVWVLADNPSRDFYARLGGEPVSEATRSFAGKPVKELGYGWADVPRYD